jgi:outer membrane biosynthesis protein TonB
MLGKLFGKKPKYFLELKEDEQKAPVVAKPEPEVAPEAVVEAVATEAPAPAEQPAKPKKTSIKKGKAKTEKAASVEVAPTVSVAPSAVGNGKAEPQEVVEFATKYLIVPSMARRRPGPSLNPYKEMARKAKLPNK